MGRDLGIFIETAPVFGDAKNNIERYKQLLDSVWVPEKIDLRDYYTLADTVRVAAASLLWSPVREKMVAAANQGAKQRAKAEHKQGMTDGLDEMISHYSGVIESCDSKIAETSKERNLAYERASVSESLALKEMEYARAFNERIKKFKQDTKSLMKAKEPDKIRDCERVIHDIQINIENCRMRARHYARQNEVHGKKADECVERIDYLGFLKGKYLRIITQAKVMLAQINSNEFNIANCLMGAEEITRHNSVMGEAENTVERQEDAQESSLELAFNNFGFAEEYSGNETFREGIERAKEDDEKKTDEELESMRKRGKRRLEKLLSS
jgi:hypothetical protein